MEVGNRLTYRNIDMRATGHKMKCILDSAGYTPRMIQEYLHLSCVQPIYRWYKGVMLPSVNHLFMLSELVNVHMEDFLVKKDIEVEIYDIEENCMRDVQRHYVIFFKKFFKLAS
ncbi:MAG: hypothetical protein IJX12_01395 [Lachnospiraceae bacterium]|nr:hypothetical protein [Lachnospiraceae bacterium]